MWILSNDTSFPADRTLACDKNGADLWLVAVKGTFVINRDGTTEVADNQLPVLQEPKYLGDPSGSSLLYESDLDCIKATTDVILHGHAYAPNGKATAQVDVAIKLHNIKKTLRVIGDRWWTKGLFGLRMTSPKPFEKMPIVYERAFGGIDQKSGNPKKHGWERRNPVGTGFAAMPRHLAKQRAPNIEDPRSLITSWRSRPRPAGFGPIARHWSPRVEFAGTYDERWQKKRFPLLPHNFSERFYQCAPEDQQSSKYLRGNEPVELHNLSSEGVMRFNLPRIALGFRTRLAGQTIEHRARLHTVVLEPDVSRVIMVWHTTLPCHGKKLRLESTQIVEKTYISNRSETYSVL